MNECIRSFTQHASAEQLEFCANRDREQYQRSGISAYRRNDYIANASLFRSFADRKRAVNDE